MRFENYTQAQSSLNDLERETARKFAELQSNDDTVAAIQAFAKRENLDRETMLELMVVELTAQRNKFMKIIMEHNRLSNAPSITLMDKSQNLSRKEQDLLAIMRESGSAMNGSEWSELSGIHFGTIYGYLKKLESSGLITVRPSGNEKIYKAV